MATTNKLTTLITTHDLKVMWKNAGKSCSFKEFCRSDSELSRYSTRALSSKLCKILKRTDV